MTSEDPVRHFIAMPTHDLAVEPLLPAIAAQADRADRTREIDPEVLAAIRASDFMSMSASHELGGLERSVGHIGRELAAVAAQCASLAWTLWNHACVFHLFAGCLGPRHTDFLRRVVESHEWVSFPAGAGSGVRGSLHGDHAWLSGRATWSTGARYGDWCGVVFGVETAGELVRPLDIRFTMVRNRSEGVTITPSWDGSGLRASATDDVHYDNLAVPLDRCVQWHGANRAESLRTVPVINHRYREDWVGVGDLWLGWMAVALVREALAEAAASFRDRRAIMGNRMADRPTVQVNLGRALALVSAAHAAVVGATTQVDARIADEQVPDTSDYYRQQSVIAMALDQLTEAMALLERTYGGNGLRESNSFDRRLRDFRAMPLHINAHQDRVCHQLGRMALGVDLEPF